LDARGSRHVALGVYGGSKARGVRMGVCQGVGGPQGYLREMLSSSHISPGELARGLKIEAVYSL
jgi:hypothetical protein